MRSFGVIRVWISDARSVWIMVHQRNRRVRSFGVIRVWMSDPKSVWIMVHQRNRGVRSFGVIRVWMSDPRSVWIMVHQRNRRIQPVPLMHHDPDRSSITDPNSDHPKGTHFPYTYSRLENFLHELDKRNLECYKRELPCFTVQQRSG